MATKLINRCLCTKVFASPSCLASSALVRRDYTIDRTILSKLKTCDGHMQDLCGFLSTTTANVRLCVIDYAGLSDNPRDKQSFIKLYRCIKEVAVDCLGIVKVYRRHDILKGDVAKKFKSRKGPVRRSA
ncbi:hypothetical protein BJV82DRAFT_332219 [Fennellomyces sp. T-0311]|nr:hypothetical protein BJV82DRAFT_332219 [Fennellomyces sp. T-0311]